MDLAEVAFFERRGFTQGPESNWDCLGDVEIIDNRSSDPDAYLESMQDLKEIKDAGTLPS